MQYYCFPQEYLLVGMGMHVHKSKIMSYIHGHDLLSIKYLEKYILQSWDKFNWRGSTHIHKEIEPKWYILRYTWTNIF